MKIAIVYGTMRKGSTYHCVQLLLKYLSAFKELSVTEYFLPRDMPEYCTGCFSCFLHGESTCPHYNKVKPIAAAFDEADLIILATPVYVYDVSGQMKALLDHFGYQWMPHRPNPKMFHKLGLAVSTAAGGGTSHTNKTLKTNFDFWGIGKVFSYRSNVRAMNWERVDSKRKEKISNQIKMLSKNIFKAYQNKDKIKPGIFTRIMFSVMKRMQKRNDWSLIDKNHWEKQGWLDGKKPW